MKYYGHFVFDVDGTLIDTERTCVLSFMQTMKELLGIEIPYDEAYQYFGMPSAKAASLLDYPDTKLFADRWEENFQKLIHMVKPFPGVLEMLGAVRNSGRHTGLVTSRSRLEFEHDPNVSALVQYVDVIVCAEDSERHKPYPDPMLAYIRKSSEVLGEEVNPQDCLYLGDTMHDFGCADSAGCDFALADWHHRGLQGIPAMYSFSSAEEVLEWLGR